MDEGNRGESGEFVHTQVSHLYRRNFEEVGELLSEAAERKAKKLDKIRKEVEKLTEETVSSFRLAGDAYSSNYAFDHALAAYKRALEYTSRKMVPHLWAAIVTQIGKAYHELGIRVEEPALNHYLSAAVDAYRQALEVQSQEELSQDWARTQTYLGTALREQGVRLKGEAGQRLLDEAVMAYLQALEVQTRGHLPQDWARTQTQLGTALREQGVRLGGEAGQRLLDEAVMAYRRALEIQTRGHLPQDWAWTQNHLGTALREQGVRLGGEAGQRLLNEAVIAYQQALEVQTFKAFPWIWTQTQHHLAHTYLALEAWLKAAASFAQLLQMDPDNGEAYYTTSLLYHEKLFAFEEALSLSQQWLASHPEDLEAHSQLVEQCFTTGRFAKAIEYLTALLVNPELEIQMRIPLQAFEIAALLSLGQSENVSEKFKALCITIANQPADFSLGWTFVGTKHFIVQDERLLPYRIWLLNLFTALEEKDRNAILTGFGEDMLLISNPEESHPHA
jgi:tetratricopeptide (TPR) repeat protein